MQRKLMRMTGTGLACISLLAGCGEMKVKQLWPFGGETAPERSRTPANATEYQCAAGKRFYVRTLDGGAAVWLILPEREVRLEKLGADGGTRYGKGSTVLEINGSDATLKDGAAVSFAGCKTAGSDTK
ncbi:MAG: MliC family protein [Rhodocyclaceae bacterium]|nr:MliC family protein [Rhodocyclaceae bacterium]